MKKRILFFLVLIVSICFTLTSCGSFFVEESKEIIEITSFVDQNDTTVLKILYNDGTEDIFNIPKGVEGNGIKEIKTTKNEKGDITTLTVLYTDEEMHPVSFDIKDGVSIKGVVSRTNEETGDVYLVVLFSDDTESEPFLLPQGEKGDGFTGFDREAKEDGSQVYYFHFSNAEDVVVTIPAPEKGDTGRGIKSIIASEEDNLYVLTINYDDKSSERVAFNRPKDPNAWISGTIDPSKSEVAIGQNGDYYFDTAHKVIYAKENDIWIKIVSFEDSTDYYYITFDLNDKLDGGVEASMPSGSNLTYAVTRNTYFTDNGYDAIPVPTRAGYKFVGWYRSRTVTATSGAFTDLTPILSDLTLYAQWEKISE